MLTVVDQEALKQHDSSIFIGERPEVPTLVDFDTIHAEMLLCSRTGASIIQELLPAVVSA